jgi:hypothetical protein
VEVHPTALVFALNPRTEVPLFAGAASLRLPLSELSDGEIDPALLVWTAKGLQPVTAAYDPEDHTVVLTPDTPWQTSDIIELIAIDAQGNEYSGLVLAQVFPVDGSVGRESEGFQLVLLPNPIQPEYIDLYVISQLDAAEAPMLRLADGAWSDLTLLEHSAGIWQTNHVFASGQQGQSEFLALSIDADRQLFKSTLTWSLDAPSGKRIATKPAIGYGWLQGE